MNEPVDVAYTWVDMLWPGYLDTVGRYASSPVDKNPERYRDAFELLRYSFRSLEKYAPWVRNVYLLTARPQVPAWIARENPRLRIVHHDEIMPGDGTLPAFNSNCIETFLHLLPGISESFLYLNDDYLLGSPVSIADFHAPDGRMKVFGTLVGERIRRRVYDRQWASFGLLEHGPTLIDRNAWINALDVGSDDVQAVRRSRFRSPTDLRPERLYRWYLLSHRRSESVAEPFWRYLDYSVFLKIKNRVAKERSALERLKAKRPKFVCINDDMGENPDPEVLALVRTTLEALYPDRCSFERSTS
jgi:hypothetical protein